MATSDTRTEQLIKDTAKQIFFTKGRLYATTQHIANAAGISRTSFHYYFRSRNELMKLVFSEAMSGLNDRLYGLMSSELPFKEKVEKRVSLFLSHIMAYLYRSTYLISQILANDVDSNKIKEQGYPFIKVFLKEIDREVKAGTILKMRPEQFMLNLFSLTSYPFIMCPLHKTMFNLSDDQFDRLINERKRLIIEMIFH